MIAVGMDRLAAEHKARGDAAGAELRQKIAPAPDVVIRCVRAAVGETDTPIRLFHGYLCATESSNLAELVFGKLEEIGEEVAQSIGGDVTVNVPLVVGCTIE